MFMDGMIQQCNFMLSAFPTRLELYEHRELLFTYSLLCSQHPEECLPCRGTFKRLVSELIDGLKEEEVMQTFFLIMLTCSTWSYSAILLPPPLPKELHLQAH